MRYVGITIGTIIGIILAVGIIAFLPPGWPRAVGAIVAILFIVGTIGSLPPGWPQVAGSIIGTVVAILIILVATGFLVISSAEEAASPTPQPTTVATPASPAATPEPSVTPKPTATPLPTMTPTATVPPCTNGITVPNPQDNPGLVADCKALLQARDTLAGSATLNWRADRAIAYWDGITVTGEPLRVTTMVLADRKLSGTIPPELAALTNLQELDLHSNQLTGPIPHQLGALTNLHGLWLYGNRLVGPIPSQLGALTELEELSLRDNQLSGPIPPQLGTLTNLRGLWLYSNQLTGPIPSQLGALTKLRELSLHDNQLTGTIPPQLGMLTNLQGLGLSGNRLTGTIPPQLGVISNLQGLWLAGNALTGCLPEGLRDVATNDFAKLEIPHCAAVAPTVYVGNTRGQGVFLRRTRNMADRIAAYPDDTPLVVLGPDTSANGITWKHVRAPDGKVGYVLAQYTVAATAARATAAAAQSRGCGPQNLRAFYARLKQDLSSAFPELVWTQTPVHTEGEARGLAADVILFDRGGAMAGDVDVELSLGDYLRLPPQQQGRSVQLAYAAIHFKVFGSLANSPQQGLLNWVSSAIHSATGTAYQTRTTTEFGCGHEVKVALLPTTKVLFFSAKSTEPTTPQPTVSVQPEPAARTVYVGNTRGQGVFLRRTRNMADRIAAYPDGTQLVVLGPDTSANGITWKHVRAPDGKVGYVPAQYTVPAVTPTTPPTPTTTRATRPQPTAARPTRGQLKQARDCLSPWDGNHNGLEALVRDQLKDPDSMSTIETQVSTLETSDLGTGYYIKMRYRAKNSLGGYVVNEAWGWFDARTCQAKLLYIIE